MDEYLNNIKQIIDENVPFPPEDYGKMIRSRLGIAAIRAAGGEIDTLILKHLAAIELVHFASLLHDDVIDNECIRRNKKLTNKTAVLYGNIILTNTINLLLSLNNSNLIKLFNSTIKHMCAGEIAQISKQAAIPSIDEYVEKSKLKTASLFVCIFEGLKILSGLPECFVEFGENFGLAFQIKNDLDNVLNSGADISGGIYTAPVIYANSVTINNDSIEKTKCLIDNYISKSVRCLDCIRESEYKNMLIEAVECLRK